MSDAPSPSPEGVPPVAQPVAITRAPPAGRQFPCPSCGARLDYDPIAAGLKCPYCGFTEEIRKDDAPEVVEKNFQEYLAKQEASGVILEGRSSQTRCGGCGAVVLLEDRMATEACPFCATHLENKPEAAAAMIPPESLLPFAVDIRRAREAFTLWIQSLWFAPTELKVIATLGQLSGVYLPYWTYDSMTHTYYDGQRGDNYQDTEWYTDSDGKQKSRTVTRIHWTSVSGEVRHFFDDVLICGSRSVPSDLVVKLEPWELDKLDGYKPDYLSGFKTERYAVGLREGMEQAKARMAPTIDTLIRQDIGGDHQRISSKDTRYTAITFKHLLLPVWIAVYRYHEKTYQILVNARTGKVSGYRPWSWLKMLRLVLFVLALLGVVLFFYLKSQK
ncbi:MAG: hypothetical protein LC104_07455 [Bacteroidales bacterium]|nr:hypothetical protein [Bacteroidales bacterium]